MKTFLQALSEALVQLNVPLEKMVVVMPNRRARRMLLQEFGSRFNKPFFTPRIYAIDEFVASISPLRPISKMEQLVQLFHVVCKMQPDKRVDFNDMLTWATAFLNDISEIDKQMDNIVRILQDLADIKSFEIPFGKDEISEEEEQKILFYKMLSDLYVQFRDTLRIQQLAYDGMLYRDCAEHIEQYGSSLSDATYIFAGFHVLNPAELEIVHFVKEHFSTHFYFDIDPFYCDFNKSPRFSTAHFLQQICRKLSLDAEKIQFQHSYFKEIKKKVDIVGTSKTMNQVYYAIKRLKEIEKEQGNLNHTALVLADEQLLLPFLSAYDQQLPNITMGYPFDATPESALLYHLIDMYQNALPYTLSPDQPLKYRHRDWDALLQSPLIQKIVFNSSQSFTDTLEQLTANTHSLCDDSFCPDEAVCTRPLPRWTRDINGFLPLLASYFDELANLCSDESKGLLYQIATLLHELEHTCQTLFSTDISVKISTLRFAIREQMKSILIPIEGNATSGLQVMGLLETRTMDFKNIVMIGVNEGILPAGISYNSIVPFDLKYTGAALESYLYKDQIYAYHFFRLLQRAENIVLTYNNDCSGSLAEKSRFISQLEFEVTEQHLEDSVLISKPTVYIPLQIEVPEVISIKKTDEIIDKLKAFEFSATALNSYLNCSLQFYLKYLCRINPPTTFKEKIESNVIGTLVHNIFQDVFDSIMAKPSDTRKIFDQTIENIEQIIHDKLLQDANMHISETDLKQGRLYLAVEMVRHDVVNYLTAAKKEFDSKTITVLGNEVKFKCQLDVPMLLKNDTLDESNCTPILLKGTIDRMQAVQDILMVMDYKTGKVDASKLRIASADIDHVFEDKKYDKLLQLFLYAVLCLEGELVKTETDSTHPDLSHYQKIECAIIAIQEANKKSGNYICPAYLGEQKGNRISNTRSLLEKADIQEFKASLVKLLARIISPDVSFEQTTDKQSCKHCDFQRYCRR